MRAKRASEDLFFKKKTISIIETRRAELRFLSKDASEASIQGPFFKKKTISIISEARRAELRFPSKDASEASKRASEKLFLKKKDFSKRGPKGRATFSQLRMRAKRASEERGPFF